CCPTHTGGLPAAARPARRSQSGTNGAPLAMPRSSLTLAAVATLALFAAPSRQGFGEPASGRIAAAPEPAREQLPDGAKVLKLEVRPAAVKLTGPFAYSQLLVTAQLDGGETADVAPLGEFENHR